MILDFRKMHGLGNDFVIVDGRTGRPDLTRRTVARLSDRRWGIGCDQLIVLEWPTDPAATVFMRIYNADGSEAGACGNATRCVAALVMAETGAQAVAVETISGLLPARDAGGGLIEVDMGPARLDWQDIPLARPMDTLHLPIRAGGLDDPVAVGMGNPHAVFIVDTAEAVDVAGIGAAVEHHPLYPEATNVQFVQVLDRARLRQRVWERGVGITRASGSGACAGAVGAMRRGLVDRRVRTRMDGGELTLHWRQTDGHVLMTGPWTSVFTGRVDLEQAGEG